MYESNFHIPTSIMVDVGTLVLTRVFPSLIHSSTRSYVFLEGPGEGFTSSGGAAAAFLGGILALTFFLARRRRTSLLFFYLSLIEINLKFYKNCKWRPSRIQSTSAFGGFSPSNDFTAKIISLFLFVSTLRRLVFFFLVFPSALTLGT